MSRVTPRAARGEIVMRVGDVVELLEDCRRRRWSGSVEWNCTHRTEQFSGTVCAPGCTGTFYRGRGDTPFEALHMAMDAAEAALGGEGER